MAENEILNPYHADYTDDAHSPDAPFAGRKMALARLHHMLTDPARDHAMAVSGRRHVGKTAFLYAVISNFSDSFVGAYVPLREVSLDSETDFVLALAQAATAALLEGGFTLSRLQEIEPPDDQPRAWLEKVFLPGILVAIRSQRQLVFLLDDADRLLPAVKGRLLPEDTFAYLHDLMLRFPQIGFTLTLDSEAEHEVALMQPLVNLNDVYRLTNLTDDETRWLLQDPSQGFYTVPDNCAWAVYKATGGAPSLVEQFGYQLFRRWQLYPDLNVVTLEDIKELTPKVYSYGEDDFRHLWGRLSLNERLVLTAISGLLYGDPLRRMDAAAIESWLVDTDYPMDITSINAALRSLEYREVVQATAEGLSLTAEMLQAWLLENARLGERAAPVQAAPIASTASYTSARKSEAPRRSSPVPLVAVAAIIGVILIVIVLVVLSNSPVGETPVDPQPTFTLADGQ
jgi:hypothetical protein